jgi:DNA replication and repair protein RecF
MPYNHLTLKSIALTNFKNYSQAELDISQKLNCFVGDNGMGKTNLLDAIHTLCLAKSHFLSSDQNLVKTDETFFRLQAVFERAGEQEEIIVKYKLRGKKQLERNRIAYKKISEHIGLLPLVIIAPDDIQLILDGSEERRKYLDLSLVQLDSDYTKALMLYNQILEQRNALLRHSDDKNLPDTSLLDYYDSQLIEPANYIHLKRKALCEKIAPLFQKAYAAISSDRETVEMRYNSQLDHTDFEQLLADYRGRDILLQRSNKGIHKDDLELIMKDQPLKRFASQGQLKSFLLAMKLAQYELLRDDLGIYPILLLDDIFDRLDPTRVKQLLEMLLKGNFGQIFLTDTHENRVNELLTILELKDAKIYMVEDGAIIL